MIGIMVASKLEWNEILEEYGISEEHVEKYPYGEYYVTKFKNKDVIFFRTGMRKTAAAGAVQYILDHFIINELILIGTCASVEDLNYGDIIIPSAVVEYDITIREVEPLINENMIIKLPKVEFDADYFIGLIGTSDKALVLWKDYLKLKEETPICASDTESAAVARVCKLNDIKCIIIKGVTDKPMQGENAFDEQVEVFEENVPIVMKNILENYLTEVI